MPTLPLHLRLRRKLIATIVARLESQDLTNNQIAQQLASRIRAPWICASSEPSASAWTPSSPWLSVQG